MKIDKELKTFFDRLSNKNNQFYSVNYISKKGVFSKNTFITTSEHLHTYVKLHNNTNCYICYNPLKSAKNRTTHNILESHLLAFDIEKTKKSNRETALSLEEQKQYIFSYLKKRDFNDYLLVCSGNGYHLYLFLHSKIVMPESFKTDEDPKKCKEALFYSTMVVLIAKELSEHSKGFLDAMDRKDIAGILRIPGTTNLKNNKKTYIVSDVKKGNNPYLKQVIEKAKKKVINELTQNIKKKQFTQIKTQISKINKSNPYLIQNRVPKNENHFFYNLLRDPKNYDFYTTIISNCTNRHNFFFCQFGFWLHQYPEYKDIALDFTRQLANKNQVGDRSSQLLNWMCNPDEYKPNIIKKWLFKTNKDVKHINVLQKLYYLNKIKEVKVE